MGRLLLAALLGTAIIAVPALVALRTVRGRRDLGSPAERAAYDALHEASLAAPPLRAGLTPAAAAKAGTHLRALLGSPAIALTDGAALLAWVGVGDHHSGHAHEHARSALTSGRACVVTDGVACADPGCPIRAAVVAPLEVAGAVVGAITAYATAPSTALVRATGEVAHWASAQLELAELDRSQTRVARAEVRALRAQISPHFIYNSLTAIASFVRTDPERARDLLLEFADFTRYSFRRHGEFTTLAEELRSIDRYLVLERARFGDRLQVTLRIAPEVLPVSVPFLCLQPLVENAVRHGLEQRPGAGHITITAEDIGTDAHICIEDDGIGMDPDELSMRLTATTPGGSIGLRNVDERLRTVYGPAYGIVVETARGAGTRVTVRVPKYAPEAVRAS